MTVRSRTSPCLDVDDPRTQLPPAETVDVIIARADLDGTTVELRFSPSHTDEELRGRLKGGIPEFVKLPDGRLIATAVPVIGYEDELRLIGSRDDVRGTLDAIA